MKNFLEKLARLFAAVGLAEEGEHDAARQLMEQGDRRGDVRKVTYGGTTAPHARLKRRAA